MVKGTILCELDLHYSATKLQHLTVGVDFINIYETCIAHLKYLPSEGFTSTIFLPLVI